jgi:hypothetical protein
LFAKDKQTTDAAPATASMKLNFTEKDSAKVCIATIVAGEKPLEGIEVRFFAKRFFSLLPLIPNGKAITTDEKGEAIVNFPKGLPGDCNGSVVIIAKVDDDEHYGSLEAKDSIKWGTIIPIASQEEEWNQRSLSATGDKAPVYLLSASGVIIIIVWGILIYVIASLFRIRNAGKVNK